MLKMRYHIIFLILGSIYLTEGLDFKIHYCRFVCSNTCEAPPDKSNPNGVAHPPTGYYFRDFYGVIPPDAYPVGSATQFPQTYIGLVYDGSNNGTFATTIFDGLDYVYNALGGNTTKIKTHIKILCTQQPETLTWVNLTKENYQKLKSKGFEIAKASYHDGFYKNRRTVLNHWIVKTKKCHTTYIGSKTNASPRVEYALIDGTYATSDEILFLMYKKQDINGTSKDTPEKSKKSRSFISHRYEYHVRPDSIIPTFYKKLAIGSCSVTCTNEDKSKIAKIKKDVKLSASMAYYWKPIGVITKDEALWSGIDRFDQKFYVGQSQISGGLAFTDVGPSNLKSTLIAYGNAMIGETSYFQVFSTNYPERFKWVNTSTSEFHKLDKNKLIPGGAFRNGTVSYICRNHDKSEYMVGGARLIPGGPLCFSYYTPEREFQVLVYDEGNNESEKKLQ